MHAKITKMSAAPMDKPDTVQFYIPSVPKEILEIRKNQECRVRLVNKQSSLLDQETGEVKNSHGEFDFDSKKISISLDMGEEKIEGVITVQTDDKGAVQALLDMGMRGESVELTFEDVFTE